MDAERWQRIRSLFEEAVELDEEHRALLLDRACGQDEELRSEVERMVSSERGSSLFLRPPTSASSASAAELALASDPGGRRIGEFELVRRIASGGMGSVFEATQDHPRRRVALKMLRPGIGGAEGIARFRREIEVLARLHHPGVASIFDAGVHEETGATGVRALPWFAMEYVQDARSLVEFAREEELGIETALELFLEVCDAVQHGHQKGIIHRDLKPSNLLVGGDGRPKVIDFGIALATDSEEHTRRTQTGELLGTLQYMSPEQFAGLPEDVDTRTDVYALGVVLFEMLCGDPPFDIAGLPLLEVARTVIEKPPLDPRRLRPDLPRDLGWILLRALAKEPAERYESASELAADLRRYLAHEPVLAGPPTTVYRVGKFVRRHRGAVAALAVIAVLLVAGLVGTSTALAERSRRLKQTELEAQKLRGVNETVRDLLAAANPWEMGGREVLAADVFDRASSSIADRLVDVPEVEAAIRGTLGSSYLGLGLYEEAERELRRSLAVGESVLPADAYERLDAQRLLVRVLGHLRRYEESLALSREFLETALGQFGADHLTTYLARKELGVTLDVNGMSAEAEPELRAAWEGLREIEGDRSVRTIEAADALGRCLNNLDRSEEAESILREALEQAFRSPERRRDQHVLAVSESLVTVLLHQQRFEEAQIFLADLHERARTILGDDHPYLVQLLSRQASALELAGRHEEAEGLYRRAIQTRDAALGPERSNSYADKHNLSNVLGRLGKFEESEQMLVESLADARRVRGPSHPTTIRILNSVSRRRAFEGRTSEAIIGLEEALEVFRSERSANFTYEMRGASEVLGILVHRGEHSEAERLLRALLELQDEVHGQDHPDALRAGYYLGMSLRIQHQREEAEEILRRVHSVQADSLGPANEETQRTVAELATLLREDRRYAEAEPWAREALEHRVDGFGKQDSLSLGLAYNLARVLLQQGRSDEARDLMEQMLADLGAVDRRSKRALAYVQNELGVLLLAEEEAGRAEPYLAAGVASMLAYFGAETADVAELRVPLGRCLLAQGRREEAEELLFAAHETLERALGPADPRTRDAASALEEVRGP